MEEPAVVVVVGADTLDELVEVGATIVLDQQAVFVASKNRMAVSIAQVLAL